jgi:transcriptional regulator with XRE-family HTH domain
MIKRSNTNFGVASGKALDAAGLTQKDLARRLEVSDSYVSAVVTGRKPASPQWVDLVANALNLSESERRKLHRAAAKDLGFKL